MSHDSPLTTHHSRRAKPALRAFTLVEMLVAMALTLILVYAIAHFYAIVGDAVKDGRAMIELNQQLRAVVERLKSDLDQVTIPVVPWADEGGAAGYLEISEGPLNPLATPPILPASDWDVNGNFIPDAEVEQNNPATYPAWTLPNVTNLLGDIDDWLGLTIRAGSVPFTGQTVKTYAQVTTVTTNPPSPTTADGLVQLPNTAANPSKTSNPPVTTQITAPYAEVAWWTSFSDTNFDGSWELNEPRFLHRRQLLIRPDLNVLHPGDTNANMAGVPYFCRIPIPTGALFSSPDAIYLFDLYQYCDVSTHPVLSNGFVYFIANSLSDLCRRENRFMHQSIASAGAAAFPFSLDLNPNFGGSLRPNLMPDNLASLQNTQPRHAAVNAFSQYRWVLFDGGRKGEDIILSNALAFDVRVFDPNAVVRSAVTDTTVGIAGPPVNQYQFSASALQPGDPGYARALAFPYSGPPTPLPPLGTGAYVDLGYGIGLSNVLTTLNGSLTPIAKSYAMLFYGPPNTPPFPIIAANASLQPALGNSQFAGLPAAPQQYFSSGLAGLPMAPQQYYAGAPVNFIPGAYQRAIGITYDTWTQIYERDGIDQDGDGVVDEGTNGLDDPIPNPSPPPPVIFVNGIDDAGERETVPPYPNALRGIQVRIRVYEPQTRQVRQATVESDFIPE